MKFVGLLNDGSYDCANLTPIIVVLECECDEIPDPIGFANLLADKIDSTRGSLDEFDLMRSLCCCEAGKNKHSFCPDCGSSVIESFSKEKLKDIYRNDIYNIMNSEYHEMDPEYIDPLKSVGVYLCWQTISDADAIFSIGGFQGWFLYGEELLSDDCGRV